MSEQWYYSLDGQELGPVAAAQLRQLAEDGSIKATDLVWREGMDDWAPAGQVKGLVAAFVPDAPPSRGGTKNAPVTGAEGDTDAAENYRKRKDAGLFQLIEHRHKIAQWLLILGIVFVLTARGCDGLGTRNVSRIKANAELVKSQFEDEWDAKAQEIQNEITAQTELRTKKVERKDEASRNGEPYSTEQLQDHNDELDQIDDVVEIKNGEVAELQEKRAKAKKKLEIGLWRDLDNASKNASYHNDMNAYWYQILFVFGSQLLTIGLLIMGFHGHGPERWICLIMLAIITFSLYVGGAAWISSLDLR